MIIIINFWAGKGLKIIMVNILTQQPTNQLTLKLLYSFFNYKNYKRDRVNEYNSYKFEFIQVYFLKFKWSTKNFNFFNYYKTVSSSLHKYYFLFLLPKKLRISVFFYFCVVNKKRAFVPNPRFLYFKIYFVLRKKRIEREKKIRRRNYQTKNQNAGVKHLRQHGV